MATAIKAGDDVRRGDLFYVDPFEIELREDLRGRKFPPSEEDIISLAMSIFDDGQHQPIQCRRVKPSNRLLCTAGFTRCAAVRLIRDGFTGTDGVERADVKRPLAVTVSDCNDETAFKRNIIENALRNQTSPVDDAFNQARLRDNYGMSDTEIAKIYSYPDASKVSRLRDILTLDSNFHKQIHDGRMSLSAALELVEVEPDKREEVAAKATTSNGKVRATKVKAQIREEHLRDAEGTHDDKDDDEEPSGPVKAKSRSISELRKYFDACRKSEDTPKPVKDFANVVMRFIAGKCSDVALGNALERLLESKATKK